VFEREAALAWVAGNGLVWMAAPDGRIRFYSPGLQRFTGLDEPPVDLSDFAGSCVHPEDRTAALAVWLEVLVSGGERRQDVRLRHGATGYRWVRTEVEAYGAPGESDIVVRAVDIHDKQRPESRLSLLVQAGEIFHRSLDVEDTLENVARLATDSFADACLFDVIDDSSSLLYISAAVHRDPSRTEALRGAAALLYDDEYGIHPAVRVATTGMTFFDPDIDHENPVNAASARHARFMKMLEYRSKIVVPVAAEGRIFGALTFVLCAGDRRFDTGDLNLAEDLGRRAGLAIANAKRYRREHHVAETLQRAFLSEVMPSRPGVSLHGVYLPGSDEADVGGDWYDAFETRDGKLIVTIGDVAGKGVDAARLMVQMREAIRVAAVGTSSPAEILAITNAALLLDRHERLATALVAVFDRDGHNAHYALAGQPPPLLRSAAGRVTKLALPSPPLGIDSGTVFEEHGLTTQPGDTLLLYTDGAIEVLRDPAAGEVLLADVFASEALPYAANPARFLQRVLAGSPLHDDVAMMVLRFGEGDVRWRFEADNPRAAYAVKRKFLEALLALDGDNAPDPDSSELIFGELIGNAVRHAPGTLSLVLSSDAEGATLHVIDQGPGFEHRSVLPDDVWSECGRGLFLITAMARSVRVERLPGYGSYIAVALPLRQLLIA
jgi:anti-sigma regulatory factor (Ser/Thr protein kinase)